MQALRQLGGGLLLGLLSVLIVFGGMSLALAEGYVPQPPPAPTETQTALPPAPTEAVSSTPSPIPTETATASPIPPTNCPPPAGWILAPILPGDTLDTLAFRYHTTPAALMAGNCLVSPYILPGYGIYVPAPPTSTAIACGAPYGWVRYTVQPGDNLYRISLLYRITVAELKQANCLTSDVISVGQLLWVPNTVTSTPPATPINIEFPTETLIPTETETALPPTNTAEPTSTEIPPSETPVSTETPSTNESSAPTETEPPPPSTP
ncbi:MAG: LysM peptidoglycan-binding domain-containing protein [Candidatus Auribacter fodinae]|uniref:LysM peptidoglycan-binding domain-containing protein n=1 Tax=Candidatus Auribacter fodinae TaxID=2093366 RepID=A0A3A4R9W3_9BACT|nr:MAG: LysM peptidoglycan-binding domain-containing protein [Candidatus Auribacter fodinae]